MKSYGLYIDGEWVNSCSSEFFETENPYTGVAWAKISRGNAEDVNNAVKAARAAFDGEWGQVKATDRGKLLTRLAGLVEREAEKLGEIEVRDNGKLIAEMGGPVSYTHLTLPTKA